MRRASQWSGLWILLGVVMLVLGSWALTPHAMAASPVTITGSGEVEPNGPGTGMLDGYLSFSFTATDDGAGNVSGTFDVGGPAPLSGSVTCLVVSGNTAVIGGSGFDASYGTEYVELFVTDGALTATTDTIGVDGPTPGGPADCAGSPSSSVLPLVGGDISISIGSGSGSGAPVSVVGDGDVNLGGSFGSFRFAAVDDGSGTISGTFAIYPPFGSSASGDVTCLVVNGSSFVLGGAAPDVGYGPLYVTIWATDGDLDGNPDTIAFDGPTNMAPPDCGAADPGETSIADGQITIRTGTSDTGHVVVDGAQTDLGSGYTRTLDVDATRDESGTVSGTFSVSESQGFSLSGDVVCLDIRGSAAMLIGRGDWPYGGTSYGYATIFLVDGGLAGAGDTVEVNAYDTIEPFGCLGAQTLPGDPLQAGDVAITSQPSGGGGPSPTPSSGTLSMTALRVQGGTLDGVTYSVTGTNGYSLTVTDGDANDQDSDPGIVSLSPLDLDATYTACVVGIPTDWYLHDSVCWDQTLTASSPIAGSAFDFEYVTPLTIDTSVPAAASVQKYGLFEKTFNLSRYYNLDVFDSRRIDVSATFTAPSGTQISVPAYWTVDYTVRAGTGVGSSEIYDPVPMSPPRPGVWRVRFSPDEVGTYTYTLRAEDKIPPSVATVVSVPLSFDATSPSTHGEVGEDPTDPLMLRYEDGTPYVPMGNDVAFQDGNPDADGGHYFDPLFASMETAGENWTRVWMTDFNRDALEWSTNHWSGLYTGVGQYSQVSAFRIDQALELADEHGLQVQLVLNDHGQFSTYVDGRWADNPYSTAHGGPVPAATPTDFFTNPEAKRLFKQRLRYLVARYGAFRNVLAWELFNEVQSVGTDAVNPGNNAAVRDAIAAWHQEMAAYLESIDPYHHLITTSAAPDSSLDGIWTDPNINLVQVHDYGASATQDTRLRQEVGDLQAAYGKPVIVGEFGLASDPERHFDPTTSTLSQDLREHLEEGTHLHNAAWAAAMSRSGAMSWWWGEYLFSNPTEHRTAPGFPVYEQVFPALQTFFAGQDPAALGLHDSTISAPAAVIALGLDNGSVGYAWVRDAQNAYGTGSRPGDLAGRVISGATIAMSGFGDGTWLVGVFDPYGAGTWQAPFVATASGGTLTIPLPDFTRDVALRIEPGGPNPTGSVPAGGTITTDTGSGATPSDPVVAGVTTPVAGTVSIDATGTGGPPPDGYGILGQVVTISAPAATAADPLQLLFRIDASTVPMGDDPSTVVVFRNGVAVVDCNDASGQASPDPCVFDRALLPDGDIQLVVLTSEASEWIVGVPGPVLGPATGPDGPLPVGTTATVQAPVADAGTLDDHVVTVDWGDGVTSTGSIEIDPASGTMAATGDHVYAQPGVYTASVEVVDPSGQSASAAFRYVVVYDPSGGFATGGGWIVPGGSTSDGGDLLPGIDGTSHANFGFVVKYKNGSSSVPGGNLTFHYNVGSFQLTAGGFDWLVVTNSNWARFQGLATIDGAPGDYPFRVDARDGDTRGGSQPDRFIIRIWAAGADPDLDEPIYKASGDVQGEVTIHRN